MRIGISGTHCCGKSTLIDAFLKNHPDYAHEPEAYELLQDINGDSFGAEPSAEDYFTQLEFHVERLKHYLPGNRVIFERSAVDYLAYLDSLIDLGRDGADVHLTKRAIKVTQEAVQELDVIAFLPLARPVDDIEDEDRELRLAVNARLEELLISDCLGIFDDRPVVIELAGTTSRRLENLQTALRSIAGKTTQ